MLIFILSDIKQIQVPQNINALCLVLFFQYCRCKWNGEKCEHDFISSTLTDMGLCYTFNDNPENILFSTNTGKDNDLINLSVLPYIDR